MAKSIVERLNRLESITPSPAAPALVSATECELFARIFDTYYALPEPERTIEQVAALAGDADGDWTRAFFNLSGQISA